MCICFLFLFPEDSPYEAIVLDNRDEYFSRDASRAAHWNQHLHDGTRKVYGGRDKQAGGTWYGISHAEPETGERFKFAVLTNFREVKTTPSADAPKPPSRGNLTLDFLKDDKQDSQAYAQSIAESSGKYNGFNLIVGDTGGFYYVTNRDPSNPGQATRLEPGRVYGVSNALLDCDWPKVQHGKAALEQVLEEFKTLVATKVPCTEEQETQFVNRCLQVLGNDHNSYRESEPDIPPLPGVYDEATETCLGSIFVNPFPLLSSEYGTRTSTITLIRKDGTSMYLEKDMDMDTKTWTVSLAALL